MAMLEFHAADHVRHLVKGTEGGGPIWNGQSGVIAGNQRTRNDKQKGHAGREDGESVESAIVRCGNGLQSVLLGPVNRGSFRRSSSHVSHSWE